MGAIEGIGSKRDATCVSCGAKFQYHPCNSAGKYCSHKCMKTHRLRLSASTGMQYRKLLLRAGVHAEDSALRVWSVIRKAPLAAQLVVMRDLMMEREAIKAEIERVAAALLPDERNRIEAECARLERALSKRVTITATRPCPICTVDCGINAPKCWKCGAELPFAEERKPEISA